MKSPSQLTIDCLIVDDEPGIAWVMEHILRGQGYTVVSVQTGDEALKAVKEEDFRLIFMDAKLPDIEGLVLARKLQFMKLEIPIIMVSGYYYPDDPAIIQAIESNIILKFIAKPFTNSHIIAALEGLSNSK
ncbi:CheY-like chemotaxis protein, response regulator receiver [Psychromonas ingrahamii 37]|uniref:CheY-like chemotaxis protein, response regulator receiver n=1 Tax=Psychromonas ingrahamii (strain DSM 17664 / CCUG 51855 / 37) TaxID=357804 RepID=A1SUB6_PSYIN|nr:response regulator [Psychromonas ingrahamii]ABM03081.1 CheY-like chemotaxis protein, response regulator receiver [Psychromonas ingrahamii 37]